MSYFCPSCGNPTEYRSELEGLCENCYRKKYTLVIKAPPRLSLKICPFCRKIQFGKTWIKPNLKNFHMVILSRIKKLKLFKSYDVKTYFEANVQEIIDNLLAGEQLIISLSVYKAGIKIQDLPIRVSAQKQICPLCMKKLTGSYYEYVIHIRFSRKKNKEFVTKVINIISNVVKSYPTSDIVDIKKISRGLDIRTSSQNIGRRIVQALSNLLGAEPRQYSERKYDQTLGKHVTVRKVMIEF